MLRSETAVVWPLFPPTWKTSEFWLKVSVPAKLPSGDFSPV